MTGGSVASVMVIIDRTPLKPVEFLASLPFASTVNYESLLRSAQKPTVKSVLKKVKKALLLDGKYIQPQYTFFCVYVAARREIKIEGECLGET